MIQELTRLIEEIKAKQPKGPRINCKTEIWANLDEGCFLIINPPEFETYLSPPSLNLQTYRRPYNIVTSSGIKTPLIT